jgi:hypothetical protein
MQVDQDEIGGTPGNREEHSDQSSPDHRGISSAEFGPWILI